MGSPSSVTLLTGQYPVFAMVGPVIMTAQRGKEGLSPKRCNLPGPARIWLLHVIGGKWQINPLASNPTPYGNTVSMNLRMARSRSGP